MTDIHSHILPGIDDGARTVEDSIILIKKEIENGVDTIVLTPHFNPVVDSLDEFLEKRANAFKQLVDEVVQQNIDINLVLGAEVFFSPELVNLDVDKLCIADTDFILIEFPFHSYPVWTTEVFYQLLIKGKTPIIAHIERYSYFRKDIETLYNHIESGCLAQINAEAVKSEFKFIKKCIDHNLVHFIATDTHSITSRPPLMKKAAKFLDKKAKGFVEQAAKNAEAVIKNQSPDVASPIQP